MTELFKKGDTVTLLLDDITDEAEWGTVTEDQETGSDIVRVRWYGDEAEGGWISRELASGLQLVKRGERPAERDVHLIVPEYLLANVAGHETEGDKPDMVNHPPHYNAHPKGIECIDIIEENPFILLGNAMKYLWRVSWGGKGNDVEDLNKAIWYIQRELKRRENGTA